MGTAELERDNNAILMALIGIASTRSAGASQGLSTALSSQGSAAESFVSVDFLVGGLGYSGASPSSWLSGQSRGEESSAVQNLKLFVDSRLAEGETGNDFSAASPAVGADELALINNTSASSPHEAAEADAFLSEAEDVLALTESLELQDSPRELNLGLKSVDEALYGDFRDATYEIYYQIEEGLKESGAALAADLDAAGVPLVQDLAAELSEIQYVDTLSQGPSAITSAVRSTIIETMALREEVL